MTARDVAGHGAVAALSFLVLAQGYRLATGSGPGTATLLAVAVGVGAVGGVLARWVGRALTRRPKRRV